MTLRFGTDGVRGRALTELTPEFARALGRAAAQVLTGPTWIVGWDPRESSPELAAAVAHGLASFGASVEMAGVVPTPALAAAGAHRGVATAMVTASHNPWHDNGVKFFAPGGLKLTDAVEAQIEAVLDLESPTGDAPGQEPGDPSPPTDVAGTYCHWLAAMFPEQCLRGLHIVLDCANGATSEVAPRVAEQLGARVELIHHQPDGRNINDRCGATHTSSLAAAVVKRGADLGLAFDGDGDRVIAIDHLGNEVDGDRLIAVAALQLLEQGELVDNTVVVTVMSNLGFHRAMEAAGITVVSTAVGDRYVLEALERGRWSIGGEQSGHIIYRRMATTGDGLLAGMHLAHFVAAHGRPLADVAGEVMVTMPQKLVNVEVATRHPHAARELAAEIAAAEVELGDTGRVLVRASGTEPLIRVMVEAATAEQAIQVAEDLAAVVRQRFG